MSAILRDSRTYEHIVPEWVGNKQRVLVSDLAGQSNIVSKAQDMGLDFDPANEQSRKVIDKIKDLEHQGYTFEAADASLELLLREAGGEMKELFTFESFKMLVEKTAGQPVVSEAFVKLNVAKQQRIHRRRRQRSGQRAGQRLAESARPILPGDQRDASVRL